MNILKGALAAGKPKDSSSGGGSGTSKWMPSVPGGDRIAGKLSPYTGKVNGMLGRETRDPGAIDRAQNHNSTPLSSLVDPSQFAPPPKHKGWYGDQPGQGQLGAPQAQQQIEYYPQGQPQYQQQQQGQPQYQQQGQPQYQQQGQPQYQQQYAQPAQSQALTRPSPAIPGRPQQEEAPLPPRELRVGPDGYADTSRPSVPSFHDGPPAPLPPRNPAGIQTKPWEPGQKKERPLKFGGGAAAAEGELTATQRYQQRTRNYGGGAASPGWNAPGQTAVAPPPVQPSAQAYQQPQHQQYQQPQYAQQTYEEPPPPPEPFRIDSTGIDTSHFAPPPKFLAGQAAPLDASSPRVTPASRAGARTGASAYPPPPSGVGATPAGVKKPAPPPRLPARQTEYPDEHTPPAPPPYIPSSEPEAAYEPPAPPAQPQAQAKPLPGINNNDQLSELQARFNRMGRNNDAQQAPSQQNALISGIMGGAAAAAAKKAPPPKPVKKVGIVGAGVGGMSSPPPAGGAGAPPPVPFASRPSFK